MASGQRYHWRPRWNGPLVLRFFLRVCRLPFLLPFLSFLFILHDFSQRWCVKFGCKDIWMPAFPLSWRLWPLGLVAAAVNAAIWLAWMLAWQAIVYAMQRKGTRGWRGTRRSQNGSPRHSEAVDEDQYMLLPDGERSSTSSPPPSPSSWNSNFSRRWSLGRIWWWIRLALYASLATTGLWEWNHYEHPNDIRFRPALQRAVRDPQPNPNGYGKGEKIFVAASFYNNEDVLPYWTSMLTKVITYLGPSNVYVSIVESYSTDSSPDLLTAYAATLTARGVPHRILVRDDAAVPKPDDLQFNNRISFLARIRNRVMEPLVESGGYERVLFSNDVFVEPESVIELLQTRDGEYDMACAMDFGHFGAYDAWVLRDRLGHLTSTIWPYFIDAPSIELMHEDAPIPTFACWNGMVVFDAEPFLPIRLRSNRTLSTRPVPSPLPPTHPAAHDPSLVGPSPALSPPLRFRAAARELGECFSSESFLVPYDMRRIYDLQRIYVNPRVVTAYGWHWYVWYKWVMGHWAVRWWVRNVWDGAWMERKKMVVGGEDGVWVWDGVDCHPWW